MELDNKHQTVTSQEIWITRHYIPPDTTYEGIFPNRKVHLTIHRKHRVGGAYQMSPHGCYSKIQLIANSTGQITWFLLKKIQGGKKRDEMTYR